MVNKVILIGRLGKDPVIKHFQNDSAIAECSLATTDSWKDKEGKWTEVTDWHNLKFPNKNMAERVEKCLKKGSQIYVEGKLKTRSYEDKDGVKRYVTEVVVELFRMLEKKSDSASAQTEPEQTTPQVTGGNRADDDLPF